MTEKPESLRNYTRRNGAQLSHILSMNITHQVNKLQRGYFPVNELVTMPSVPGAVKQYSD